MDTLASEQLIGLVLLAQCNDSSQADDLERAEKHLRHVLDQRMKNFPDGKHPSIFEAQHHLARIPMERDTDSSEAKELLESALKSRTEILGADHPDTKATASLWSSS